MEKETSKKTPTWSNQQTTDNLSTVCLRIIHGNGSKTLLQTPLRHADIRQLSAMHQHTQAWPDVE